VLRIMECTGRNLTFLCDAAADRVGNRRKTTRCRVHKSENEDMFCIPIESSVRDWEIISMSSDGDYLKFELDSCGGKG
jgi:hypothetical protein